MSGHSKWSSIKRQKGVNDKKKGLTFTKLGKAITIAVKQGGGIGDPNQNFRLRLAIDAARAENMPKENIERSIQRASEKNAGEVHEVLYEGFAPGGVSIIVEAATDNPMRTTSEVKNVFNKAGGSFGQQGSVAYQFKHVGRIIAEKGAKSFDDIFSIALDNNAEDIEEVGDEVFIYTEISNLTKIKDALGAGGVEVVEADLIREPIVTITVEEPEKLARIESFVTTLEEMDDIQKVYTNLA
jgi:YebC/PmpR family DNA-binding regulatory protein